MSIRKNIVYNVALQLSNVLFPFITMPYVSRVLEPDNIGRINSAVSYTTIFIAIAVLGLPVYGMREIAKHHEHRETRSRIFSELFSINLLSTLLCTAVYVASIFLVPQLYEERAMLLLSGVSLYLCSFSVDWFFQGMSDFKLIALRSIILKVLCILAMFLFVHDRGDAIVYLGITVLSTVASNAWNMWYLTRHYAKITLRGLHLKRHLKPLLIIFSTQVSVMVYVQFDIQMLKFLSDYTQVGLYTSVTTVVRKVIGVVNVLGISTVPLLSAHVRDSKHAEVKNVIDKSFSFLAFLSVPLAIGTIVTASHFIPLFFGSEFNGAIVLLQLMGVLFIVFALNGICAMQILIPYHHEKQFLLASSLGCVISILLNLLLIPFFAARGAMMASVATESLITGLLIWYVYRHTTLRFHWSELFRNLLICLPFVPFHYAVSALTHSNALYLCLMIPLCAIYYFLVQLAVKNKVSLELIKTLLKR